MKNRVLLLSAVLVLSGCATARLPQGPDIYSFSVKPGAPSVVVARVVDERTDKKRLGSIGATQYSMSADPSELVAKETVAALYEQGFNGTLGNISPDQPDTFAEAARRYGAQAVLTLQVKSLSIESFDIVMDPPTAKATVRATLYDPQGKPIDSAEVTGLVQKRISMFAFEKASGELVGEAVHDAAQRLVSESALGGALTKLSTNTAKES